LAGGYAAALCLRSATRVLHLIHEEDLNPNRAAGDTVRAVCTPLTICVAAATSVVEEACNLLLNMLMSSTHQADPWPHHRRITRTTAAENPVDCITHPHGHVALYLGTWCQGTPVVVLQISYLTVAAVAAPAAVLCCCP
jgi:hypothetical protein